MSTDAPFGGVYSGRRVLVTGHTGFKGAWLCLWLRELGAELGGYALAPDTEPSLFRQSGLERTMDSRLGDVRDADGLRRAVRESRPEIVFHLAAQALVRRSYDDPAGTFSTNVMGTVNLLEALRGSASARACVVVTSDKCYEEPEAERPRVEGDPLGGRDPYSASKACAELVAAAYRSSFFGGAGGGRAFSLSSARAGNVIGGGDWAADRILPDCVRAISRGEDVVIRNPGHVRPWQHVLEPLSGYLWLAARQFSSPGLYDGAWNFGPEGSGEKVAEVADIAVRSWGAGRWVAAEGGSAEKPEASALRLDCRKARERLGWRTLLTTRQAVEHSVAWYRDSVKDGFDAAAATRAQISDYVALARRSSCSWAAGGEPHP